MITKREGESTPLLCLEQSRHGEGEYDCVDPGRDPILRCKRAHITNMIVARVKAITSYAFI